STTRISGNSPSPGETRCRPDRGHKPTTKPSARECRLARVALGGWGCGRRLLLDVASNVPQTICSHRHVVGGGTGKWSATDCYARTAAAGRQGQHGGTTDYRGRTLGRPRLPGLRRPRKKH